jgi:YD repeat-containing protein
MRNNLLLLLALMTLSISSCKKKVEDCKLGKSYASDGSTTPSPNTFSYYSDGRLQKVVYANGTTDTLAYSNDSVYILTLNNVDSVTAVFAGKLNSSGYVTSARKDMVDYAGNVLSTEEYALEYNAEGNLTRKTVTNLGGTTDLNLNYDAGNPATGTLYYGSTLDRRYIFFPNTVENKTGLDALNSVLTPYFGKPSENLLDSTYIITSADDTIRVQYAHTLDANEYVSKTIQTYLTHETDTRYFTYQYFDCNE